MVTFLSLSICCFHLYVSRSVSVIDPVLGTGQESLSVDGGVEAIVHKVAGLGQTVAELAGSSEGSLFLNHICGGSDLTVTGLVEDVSVFLGDLYSNN